MTLVHTHHFGIGKNDEIYFFILWINHDRYDNGVNSFHICFFLCFFSTKYNISRRKSLLFSVFLAEFLRLSTVKMPVPWFLPIRFFFMDSVILFLESGTGICCQIIENISSRDHPAAALEAQIQKQDEIIKTQ